MIIALLTCVIGLALSLLPHSHAQVDPQWCPGGLTPPVIDPMWSTIPDRFELMAELHTAQGIMEIGQAFSSTRDSIIKISGPTSTSLYWDYTVMEYLYAPFDLGNPHQRSNCQATKIVEETSTSLIEIGGQLLKPSILLGFTPRNQLNPNWGIVHETTGFVRDIPTNIFKSCFHIDDINATAQVTYHVSDVTKFEAYLPANESLLLQFDVKILPHNGEEQAYTYNIFYYVPNPSRWQERQALETPAGVYCIDRAIGRDVPSQTPDRVSANAEIYFPEFHKFIVSTHNLYDTEYQFSRNDFWGADPSGRSDWRHFTEIHDFRAGLSYRYNHDNRRCYVTDINANTSDAVSVDSNPSQFQMGTSQHLFLLDDMTYQYTGEKWCRDRVRCNVWIGENAYPNKTVVHREWYWAISVNGQDLKPWIPMKLVIKRYENDQLNYSSEMVFYNYRDDPRTAAELGYTLADCYRALGPSQSFNLGVLSFKIANDQRYPILDSLNQLRLEIWERLLSTLHIRPIRLSHLIVDQDNQDILVTFTLLDAAPMTGPVEIPLAETSLGDLIQRLENVINSNALYFQPTYNNKKVTLRARAQSLNINRLSSDQRTRSAGPLITGLWIGCAFAGLLIGGVASFFIFEKLARK